MGKKYCFRISFLLLAMSLFAAACSNTPGPQNSQTDGPTPEPKTAGVRGGTLTYKVATPPKTFNVLLAADESSLLATFILMSSRVVEFDQGSQTYKGGLAETWATAEDGRTVDMTLREGLKFSDGHPITTDDVIFTLNAVYDPRTKSPAFGDAFLIDGKKIETTKIDDRRMKFVFPSKVASVENYLDNLTALPKHKLEAAFNSGKFAEAWSISSDPNSIAASGPFMVESSEPGERVTLKRNEYFFKKGIDGAQLPYLEKVILQVVADPNNAFASLEQGTLDIADRIRPSDFAELSSKGGPVHEYDLGAGLGTDHFWFNLNRSTADGKPLNNDTKYKWFSDKRFRMAVSMTVDRETICKVTLKGLATPLYGFVSPANKKWLYPELEKTPYDIEGARKLLAEAGFKQGGTSETPELTDDGGNRVEFTLLVGMENEPRKLMAAVIQEDLGKLGIKMNVVPIENQAITERWSKSFDYDAILLGLSITGIDPIGYSNLLLSGSSVHQWQPNQKQPATEWEAKIDDLFADQAGEPNEDKRHAAFNEIQKIMADESPIIPVASRHILSAVNQRIGNYAMSSIFPYSLWNAEELFIKP